MHKKLWITAIAGLFALGACGDTLLEQGLLGAGAGAGAAVATGGDAATGAVIGAAGNVACQNYLDFC